VYAELAQGSERDQRDAPKHAASQVQACFKGTVIATSLS